jgi:hypothetical protein
MQQREDDRDIERYLRKFQLRAVRPLKMQTSARSSRLRWRVAAAAVVVFAGCVALWFGAHQTAKQTEPHPIYEVRSSELRPPTRISTLALTKLALDDSKAFDAVLTDESRNMFPNMRGEQSALRALAKE